MPENLKIKARFDLPIRIRSRKHHGTGLQARLDLIDRIADLQDIDVAEQPDVAPGVMELGPRREPQPERGRHLFAGQHEHHHREERERQDDGRVVADPKFGHEERLARRFETSRA